MFLLFTNAKSHKVFRLISKLLTSNSYEECMDLNEMLCADRIGTWTNWLTLSPIWITVRIHEPDFCISARHLKKLWTDFDEILCVGKLLKNACMNLDEMLHVDRCRDMNELINCPIRIIARIHEPDLHRIFEFQPDIWRSYGQISMKFYGSIAAEIWTNWLRFELDPDHSPDPGTRLTPDFWILAGYLKKLLTDFEDILCVDSCWGLHDLVRFWARTGSESGSWIQAWIQNFKADSSNSNGQISMKFYSWIACESRKTAFNFGSDRDWDWLGVIRWLTILHNDMLLADQHNTEWT